MRKIDNGDCPQVLLSKAVYNDLHRMQQDVARGDNPKADRKIYAHSDVKNTILNSHKWKCACCERNLNGDFGHIEHYRPKGGFINPATGKLVTPGYWWLAYSWDNLLLSCSRCNTIYKQNHFPLEDENQRNIAGCDISQEKPLLINPAQEDPARHIEFHRWMVCPKMVGDCEDQKGKTTIEILQLNSRRDLVEKRKRRWEWMEEDKSKGIDIAQRTGEQDEFTGMFQNNTFPL